MWREKKADGLYKVQAQATLSYTIRNQYSDYSGGGSD